MMDKMKEDRIAFLDDFGKMFFSVSLINHPVSAPLLDYYRMLASVASPRATQQCALAFAETDFRNDVKSITVPTLIIHGDDDKTVPIESSSERTAKMIPNAVLKFTKERRMVYFIRTKGSLTKTLSTFANSRQALDILLVNLLNSGNICLPLF
jgi:pimeloyl-ACP methyl ester carboxylesterase